MTVYENFSLKPFNTFNIDAKAQYFAEVTATGEIEQLLGQDKYRAGKILVLGGGSNVLFTGDFDGLVLKNSIKGIDLIKEENGEYFLRAMSGEIWDDFVEYTVERELAGVENLTLIPGTVGAAPIQNIGAYGTELKDTFYSLEALDLRDGRKITLNREECRFGYRDSIFKQELKGCAVITSVIFRMHKYTGPDFSYEGLRREFEGSSTPVTIRNIRETVKKIRTAKLPDTAVLGNAGSFFKNPEISSDLFDELKEKYPAMPGFKTASGSVKVPAGFLIEKAGFRGKRIGNAGSYANQALVVVNYGGASGKEILQYGQLVQSEVMNMFGIEIHMEVNII